MNSSILYTNFIQYLPPQANRKRQKEEKEEKNTVDSKQNSKFSLRHRKPNIFDF